MRLFHRLGKLRGRRIGRKRLLRFHRRRFFCNERSDLLLHNFRRRRDRGGFLDGLGKGELDAGKVKRRQHVRLRRIFETGHEPRGDKTVNQEGKENCLNNPQSITDSVGRGLRPRRNPRKTKMRWLVVAAQPESAPYRGGLVFRGVAVAVWGWRERSKGRADL